MTIRQHIRAIGEQSENTTTEAEDSLHQEGTEEVLPDALEAEVAWDLCPDEEVKRPLRPILLQALALLAVAAWTGFFIWAVLSDVVEGGTPQQWIGWTTSWAVPVILVAAIWLLAMRNSVRESRRFGEISRHLSQESALLEERLATVNRELSLAREFLSSQARELDYLGRSASERIAQHAASLQALVVDNSRQVDAIASVSVTALENMTKLRDNLPVVANSARDVSNQIGGAGRTAQAQLAELVSGFERLNEFGGASERQVAALRASVDEAMAAFSAEADRMAVLADQRFAALRAESEAFRGELDSREVDSLASIRARAEALRVELADAQLRADAELRSSADTLAVRIGTVRDEAHSAAEAFRTGEATALSAWQAQIEALQIRLQTALEEVSELDAKALESANLKLRALADEALAVDSRLVERNTLFEEEMAARRAQIDMDEALAAQSLAGRLALIDEAIAARREEQRLQLTQLERESEALEHKANLLGQTFATAADQGREARESIDAGIAALDAKLVDTREALDGTDMAVAALTDASVRLLELIQASAKQTKQDLPEALNKSEARLAEIEDRSRKVCNSMDEAIAAGNNLISAMEAVDQSGASSIAQIELFRQSLDQVTERQRAALAALREDLGEFGTESDGIARRTQDELRAALALLEESAREAVSSIEREHTGRIDALAQTLGERSAEAIAKAMGQEVESQLTHLDEMATRSTEAGRAAAAHLRDQLVKVNELATNLEARVAQARERAEDQVDNDFSRRVALISESLNSNAIDIAKALSTEVTDIAWASYLKGDRGIFTRRAVRLLDNSEAREIAELYDADHEFRDHVNRYIHDFEAMLRTLLSTRDGHAVSVTLLSSDMGKLYVILAQALERLRQ